jgi:hypothetical protein
MGKFPNHVAINKPIPSKLRFENGIRLKQTYANTYHPNRNKSRYNTIEDIGKKGDFILGKTQALEEKRSDKFDDKQYRNKRS